MTAPLRFENVEMKYGTQTILPSLSFSLDPASITVLLGPNGAGKTTSLMLALGLLSPTSGQVRVLGEAAGSNTARRRVGFAPQELDFPNHLTAHEVLCFKLALTGHSAKSAEPWIEVFSLQSFLKTTAGRLSGGQKRRLALALAFAGEPDLLVLDEPTTGLDVESRLSLWTEIEKLSKRGGSALVTTHDIDDLAQMQCRGLMLVRGQIQFDGLLSELLHRVNEKKLHFTVHRNQVEAIQNLLRSHVDDLSSQVSIRAFGDQSRFTVSTRSAEALLKVLLSNSNSGSGSGSDINDVIIERNQWDRLQALKGSGVSNASI